MSNHICDCVAVFGDQLKNSRDIGKRSCKWEQIAKLSYLETRKSHHHNYLTEVGTNSTLKSLNQRTTFC